jgi:hypothetical protein
MAACFAIWVAHNSAKYTIQQSTLGHLLLYGHFVKYPQNLYELECKLQNRLNIKIKKVSTEVGYYIIKMIMKLENQSKNKL